MESIAKRKTTTSSEVKTRWNAKTYKAYGVHLRKDSQSDLIAYIEEQKKAGRNTSDIFAEGIEKLKEGSE